MNRCLLILIVAIANSEALIINWGTPHNEQQFLKLVSSRQPTIAFIYDSQRCPICKVFIEQRINKLPHHPKMKSLMMNWANFDTSIDKEIKKNLELKNKLHIRYYNQRRYFDMPDANELTNNTNNDRFNHNEVFDKIYDFLKNILESFSKEPKDVNEINEVLSRGEPVILYIGLKNQNFKTFYEFASTITDIKLFHSFDPRTINDIKALAEITSEIEDDTLIVIRPTYINMHIKEPKSSHFRFPMSYKHMYKIAEFESYPKLRDHTYNEHNLDMLESKHHTIILYSRSELFSLKNWMHYKRFVKVMPKHFIYSYSSNKYKEHQLYVRYFERMGVPLEEERVYMIHRLKGQKDQIETYDGHLNAEGLVMFFADFFNSKKPFLSIKTKYNLDEEFRRVMDRLKEKNADVDEL